MPFKPFSESLVTSINTEWATNRSAPEQEVLPRLASLLSMIQTQPVSTELLMALSGSTNRTQRYHSFNIMKRQGGQRVIDSPEATLKWIQRSILRVLTCVARPHKCAHGFVEQRSIISHASIHVNSRWVFVTDIQDFFPSIHWGRVYGLLQSKPFRASPTLARFLANLVTYQGRLPQGSPTSPYLSNIVCRRMDHELFRWARNHGFRYSRYADDLTFSTNKRVVSDEDREEIEAIVKSEGFAINELKRRTVPNQCRQVVTGLVVNGSRPNVRRESVKNLRALLHNVVRHGWASQAARNPAITSAAELADYFKSALSLGRIRVIQSDQREHHLLLRPLLAPPKTGRTVSDLLAFQKAVKGKYDFIAQVRGKDICPSLYRLAEQAFSKEILESGELFDQFVGPKRGFHRFVEKMERVDSIDGLSMLGRGAFAKRVLELGWRLAPIAEALKPVAPGNMEMQDALRGAKQDILALVHSASLMSARYTARFFRYFSINGYFKEILQRPNENTPPVELVIQRCMKRFQQYRDRLPHQLRDKVEDFLTQCARFVETNPGVHPWAQADFLEQRILPFKRGVVLDEDPTNATDLIGTIRALVRDVPVKIESKRLRPLFTDVDAVRDGMKHILSTLLNGKDVVIRLAAGALSDKEAFLAYNVTFSASTLPPRHDRSLIGLFKEQSPLRDALAQLRGHVDWTITAEFADGYVGEFDVMRNRRLKPSSYTTGGVQHRLTFYRYVP